MEAVLEAERLGFSQVWTGEAYGTDAVSPVAWVLARTTRIKAGTGIMQIPARTPACAAMTAMTLQALSGNRFLCGVGVSGPQVVEGWHGVRVRQADDAHQGIHRDHPPDPGPRGAARPSHGEEYVIPYAGPDATGLGKPLRSIMHGDPSLPFYTASITPAGLRTAGEVADGTLPIFYLAGAAGHRVRSRSWKAAQKAGRRAEPGRVRCRPLCAHRHGRRTWQRAATRSGRNWRCTSAAWGRGRRISTTTWRCKLGYEDAAAKIQDLYLDGKKTEAAAAVPDALIDEISLVGPRRAHPGPAGGLAGGGEGRQAGHDGADRRLGGSDAGGGGGGAVGAAVDARRVRLL